LLGETDKLYEARPLETRLQMGEPGWREAQRAPVLGYCTESPARVWAGVGHRDLALRLHLHPSSSQ